MNFESLRYFFHEEYTARIICNESIPCTFIVINSIDERKYISFSCAYRSAGSVIYTGTISENDAIELRRITESSSDYFAKIISNRDGEVLVSFIIVNKIPILEDIPIGIGEAEMGYAQFIKSFKDEFTITIANKEYYIFGKHISANFQVFSLLGLEKKYDVLLTRREECGPCKREEANEQIWAITKKKKSYKLLDYVYQIRPNNLIFGDISSVTIASEQNKIEVSNQAEDGILSRWEEFAKKDYSISVDKVNEVDSIRFHSYIRESNNIITFLIEEGFNERLKKLKDHSEKNTSGLVLDIYENETGRRKGSLDFITVSNNTIRCRQETDYIFKNEGFFRISNYGSEMIYSRRMNAIQRIRNNFAAKRNILSLINGRPLHNKLNKPVFKAQEFYEEILHAFNGKQPNSRQLEAIEIAINTPDFCIIQGPPGCGKTSLINAIDECLSKIDSSKHRYGASLSTAYQRESTRNMIATKLINGVPVPFISNNGDYHSYVENHFLKYIEDIADKLKNKYPEIVDLVGQRNALVILSDLMSGFNKEYTLLDSLAFLIQNLLNLLEDSLLGSEIIELEEILKEIKDLILIIVSPNRKDDLGYLRMIPTSLTSFEDEGMDTFLMAKINLCLFDNGRYFHGLNIIESEFKKVSPNFEVVKKVKQNLIIKVKNTNIQNKNLEINYKVSDLLFRIQSRLAKDQIQDNQALLVEYIDSFLNNPLRVRQALEPWITSVAATHQISGDTQAIPQSNPTADYVEYDNVLIDEAARSCPPDLIIPIACAKNRIIMVGDHRQLPQFINDEVLDQMSIESDIKHEMKNISMFEYLISTTKKLEDNDNLKRFIALNEQYRMPKILGDFISTTFYPDIRIESPLGNPDTNINFVQTFPHISRKCMVWCDVPYGEETKSGKNVSNQDEAKAIAKILYDFLENQENEKLSIGIITFYRDQVRIIKEHLLSPYNIYIREDDQLRCNQKYKDRLRIDTVDAFQGIECDIIILSMVRSNPLHKFRKESFGFMQDERRLCVALSRQKRCLVVVGNGSGMLNTDVAKSAVKGLAEFYEICRKGGEFIDFIESKSIVL